MMKIRSAFPAVNTEHGMLRFEPAMDGNDIPFVGELDDHIAAWLLENFPGQYIKVEDGEELPPPPPSPAVDEQPPLDSEESADDDDSEAPMDDAHEQSGDAESKGKKKKNK